VTLAVTVEQAEMTAAVRAFLADRIDLPAVLESMEQDDGVLRELWRAAAVELGLAGLLVPAEQDGTGLELADLVLVLEELGRRPMGLPMLSTGVLAGWALRGLEPAEPLLAAIAAGDRLATVVIDPDVVVRQQGSTFTVHGVARHVLDGHVADVLLVATADGLFAVAAEHCDRRREDTVDLTRPLAAVEFVAAPATRLGPADPVELADVGALAVAASAVGGAARCLDNAVAHALTRTQFDRPIGANQAIKHTCADLLRALEPARAAVRLAARAAGSAEFGPLVSVAKAHATDTYWRAACDHLQIHGALGQTWEHEAHLHYKRAVTDQLLFGEEAAHRERIVGALGQTAAEEPDDHPELRAEVRAFLATHREIARPAGGAHQPHGHRDTEADRHWRRTLREGRWLCLSWPTEYGGRALSELEIIAVNEEFARAGIDRPQLGMGESLVAPALLAHGTPEQKARFLPRILTEEDVYCQGFSEPEAGSDLAGLRTRGRVEGTELVLDGHKTWTTGADNATMMFALCRTDPEAARHRGLTYVLVPLLDNGILVRPIRQQSGGSGFCEEFVDGARAPLDNVIGGLGHGWQVAMTTLGAERTGEITTQYLGYRRELEHLVTRLGEQGRLTDPLVRQELARLAIGVQLLRASGARVADELRAGRPVEAELAVDKLNWSEFHCDFGAAAVRLQGLAGLVRPAGPGYQLDEFQRVFTESRGRRIARGTNQIQRDIIAHRVLRLPKA
jgi:alkylation response protein AidB-like acyl-CoA dehydrogenase